MHFKSLILTTVVSILAVAKAQVLAPWWASLSPCAQACAQVAADKAGCAIDDLQCLCNSPTFLQDFQNCAQTCPSVSPVQQSPVSIFSNACVGIDWTWGQSPCIRKCLLKAAQSVGCALNDRVCLCRNRAAFLAAFFNCIKQNCPVEYQTAQNFITFNFTCPIVDPPLPTATAVAL